MELNTLYYGDCLEWMEQWPDECVDLIYLDPPFNSNANYNILFSNAGDNGEKAQYRAFNDTWYWDAPAAERTSMYRNAAARPAHSAIAGLHHVLGECGMLAYLTYMAERLEHMHRLLKPTGSIYLHCDPTASHYLKIVMDAVFGIRNFRNEITWERIKGAGKTSQHAAKSFGRSSDTILFYSKSDERGVNAAAVALPYESLEESFPLVDEKGRYKRRSPFRPPGLGPRPNLCYEYKGISPPHPSGWTVSLERLRELDGAGELDFTEDGRVWRKQRPGPGVVPNDFWGDIPQAPRRERLGYPTQKPLALLERIVKASSNEGDVVLDPFCGCGAAVDAALRLNRRWAGIDISSLAIDLIRNVRLKDSGIPAKGMPFDLASARKLAAEKPFDFESWAITRLPGFAPNVKQTGDRGIDGRGTLAHTPENFDSRLALAQVKGGRFRLGALRDFIGVMERDRAAFGCYITLDSVDSREARSEAARRGKITVLGVEYDRVQLWSIRDYFADRRAHMPVMTNPYTGKVMDQTLNLF